MEAIQIVLEIVKYMVPALVVYFLMRQFIKGQLITEQLKITSNTKKDTLSLRLQAYERLALFCERINLISLMMRLNNSDMLSQALKNAMLVSVQKEYEHNMTQQIYISGQLWEMITLLKEHSISAITQSYIANEKEEKEVFVKDLLQKGQMLNSTMNAKVKEAIRKELEIYFQ